MSEHGTGELIDSLVADLAPVRRTPALRVALAGIAVAWSLSFVLGLVIEQTGSAIPGRMLSHWSVPVVLLGLAAAAIGGALTGLAASVPGREGVARYARLVALAGLVLAASSAWLAATLAEKARIVPLTDDAACFALGVGLALLPGGALLFLLVRGWVQRPLLAAAMALIGGFALGATTMQTLCPVASPRHMLFGHVCMPLAMTVVLALPLAALIRRVAR